MVSHGDGRRSVVVVRQGRVYDSSIEGAYVQKCTIPTWKSLKSAGSPREVPGKWFVGNSKMRNNSWASLSEAFFEAQELI